MASIEQLQLSNFIKKTHENLRNEAKRMGADIAWKKHCNKKDILEEYSSAMKNLATKYWKNEEEFTKVKCRIHWIHAFCLNYFFQQEILRQRNRELEIAKKIKIDFQIENTDISNHIKLLDVGSCFNPFKEYTCFDVLAIDIAPANTDVHYCDFLNLNIVDYCNSSIKNTEKIVELLKNSFDVIVFCLFLEYLPSPEQRLLCCVKAYELLKYEGLLIIITPDSKHVGANAKLMKSWRHCLAKLGFSRIKYEKLIHVHCMSFRKSIKKEIAVRWAELQNNYVFFDQLFIPQDFNLETFTVKESIHISDKNKLFLLAQLPNVPS